MKLFYVAVLNVAFLLASAAGAMPKQTPELVAKGKVAFATNCVVCHGEKGDGNGPAGMALNPKPRDFTAGVFKNGNKPEQIFKTITDGLPGTPMAGFKNLPEDDRAALAYYVLSLKK